VCEDLFLQKIWLIIRVFITIKKACGEKSALSPQAEALYFRAFYYGK
jgi:hypothetical protein